MAGQVCFAHQIGQKGQEKLHNERHKWKLGGGTEGRGLGVWFCKVGGLVVLWYKAHPPPPPPPTQSQMDIIQWSVHKLQDENMQRL